MALSVGQWSQCVLKTVQRVLNCARTITMDDFEDGDKVQKAHPEAPLFKNEYSSEQLMGRIYDKKPFKVKLEANKNYFWCVCGYSKWQPFCDGSHKHLWMRHRHKNIGEKWLPLRFKVQETREYWLCNCKQSGNRPFCDGTHRQSEIQEAVKL